MALKFFSIAITILLHEVGCGVLGLNKVNDRSRQASPAAQRCASLQRQGGLRMPMSVDNWQVMKLHILEEGTAVCEASTFTSPLCLFQHPHLQMPWGIQVWIRVSFSGARFGRWEWDKGHLVAVMHLVLSQVSWGSGDGSKERNAELQMGCSGLGLSQPVVTAASAPPELWVSFCYLRCTLTTLYIPRVGIRDYASSRLIREDSDTLQLVNSPSC